MENPTGVSITKVVMIGVLGLVVGFGTGYFWLSKKTAPRDSASAPVAQKNENAVEEDPTRTPPAEGTVLSDAVDNVAEKIRQTPQENAAKMSAGMVAGNSISVSDQSAGGSITVAAVSLDKRGWAVIHQDERGAPGWVLGARRLEPGSYTNETVELLRATTPGNVYYAMLHNDDGVDTFDLHKDLPVTDASGNPVMMRFKTTEG